MIGRGTRLCPGLFGTDENGKPKDKTHFQIFDHWGNFEYFDELAEEAEPKPTKSLLQRLFEARLELADTALNTPDIPAFDIAAELISQDIADLPDKSISIIEKYKEVNTSRDAQLVHQFAPATVAMLRQDLASSMRVLGEDRHHVQSRPFTRIEIASGVELNIETDRLRKLGRAEAAAIGQAVTASLLDPRHRKEDKTE